MAKVRADQIKAALAAKHADDFFLTEVKDGPTQSVRNHFKLDALAFKKSWANPAIIGYEVKVSRQDFQRDDKWPAYLPLCNQFSFVCPTGMIQPDELPQEVGLIYYNPEKGTLYTKRKAQYRLIDEPVNMYKYIMMSKLDSDRHPFFSSRREYFEAMIEDKAVRGRLGYYVAKKVGKIIEELEEKIRTLERENARFQNSADDMKNIKEIFAEAGIRMHWGWERELKERLTVGVSGEMTREIQSIKRAVERLEQITKGAVT